MSNPAAIFNKDVEISGNSDLIIKSGGKLGIGLTNPSTQFDVDGSGSFSGNLDICGNVKIGPNGTYQSNSNPSASLLIHEPGLGTEAARDAATLMLAHQDILVIVVLFLDQGIILVTVMMILLQSIIRLMKVGLIKVY